jgi:glycosyltransferase involved in cell wall biosynthesis
MKREEQLQIARDTVRWKQQGISFHSIRPNNSNDIKKLLLKVKAESKNMIVIYDRFYNEEMFSFHVREHCPHAFNVLDLQDLHSLRLVRQEWIEQIQQDNLSFLPLRVRPSYEDPRLLRELASIHRCDLTLVCSDDEIRLLHRKYQVVLAKMLRAPLFGTRLVYKDSPWEDRHDYVFLGGFQHAPNVDAVRQLKRLWPTIRRISIRNSKIQDTAISCHIYGAYCSDQLKHELHDPETGFIVHGYHPEPVSQILSNKRVMLSPLRFGAGVKGKHVEAWKYGLPVVTTAIGAEGMVGRRRIKGWGGRVAYNDYMFVEGANKLYNGEARWMRTVERAQKELKYFCGQKNWDRVAKKWVNILRSQETRRVTDMFQRVLWLDSNRGTESFGNFIETKERIRAASCKKRSRKRGKRLVIHKSITGAMIRKILIPKSSVRKKTRQRNIFSKFARLI